MSKRTFISFDWAMKKLLRQKANFGILEGFLSELLKKDIKVKQILESQSNKKEEDDKYNHVDLLCENTQKEIILIVLQFKVNKALILFKWPTLVSTRHILSAAPNFKGLF